MDGSAVMEVNLETADKATEVENTSKGNSDNNSNIFAENSIEKTLANALMHGIQGHKNGHLKLAEELYETILEIDPNHAQANHCMGVLKTDMGNDKEALPYLENAIIADGSILRFWGSLIKTLNRLGDLEEAKKIIGLARDYGANDEEIKTLETELYQ